MFWGRLFTRRVVYTGAARAEIERLRLTWNLCRIGRHSRIANAFRCGLLKTGSDSGTPRDATIQLKAGRSRQRDYCSGILPASDGDSG